MVPRLSGTVGATTLTVEQLASHNHYALSYVAAHNGQKFYPNNDIYAKDYSGFTGESQSHTHTLSGATSSQGNNLPLYYVLSFIMRCV